MGTCPAHALEMYNITYLSLTNSIITGIYRAASDRHPMRHTSPKADIRACIMRGVDQGDGQWYKRTDPSGLTADLMTECPGQSCAYLTVGTVAGGEQQCLGRRLEAQEKPSVSGPRDGWRPRRRPVFLVLGTAGGPAGEAQCFWS